MIHFTAALQSSRAKNVVGAMWSVDDQVIHVVEVLYEKWLREDGVFDPTRTARALRVAMRATRDKVPLEQRIAFVHIGA